jgi:adenosylcobinamide kinase/adenosylcobinamide-phosphate guanylyltransferase
MGRLILITGGARSGKSRLAERLASEMGPKVLYLATLEPGDEEMARRVEAHRASRPAEWQTVEEPREVVAALDRHKQVDVWLLDCLTLWVSNLNFRRQPRRPSCLGSSSGPDRVAETSSSIVNRRDE